MLKKMSLVAATLLVLLLSVITAARSSRPYPNRGRRAPDRDAPVGAVTKLAPNLYLIQGAGCNTGVFVTSTGVVLVDTKFIEGWTTLVARVATITDKPITHVINTHRHLDHTEANTQLPQGVQVVYQKANVAEFLARAPIAGVGAGTYLGTRPIEFDDHLKLFDGPDEIDLYHFGSAHTDGDTFVVFPGAGVMFTGDVMIGKVLPIIVNVQHGSGVTYPGVLDRAVSTIHGVDRVVTGHGPVVPWSDFVDYGVMSHLMLDHVRSTMGFFTDKTAAFRSFRFPERFNSFDTSRAFLTLDEIDRSLRPSWQRVWPLTR